MTSEKKDTLGCYLVIFTVVSIVVLEPMYFMYRDIGWWCLLHPVVLFLAFLAGAGAADNKCH